MFFGTAQQQSLTLDLIFDVFMGGGRVLSFFFLLLQPLFELLEALISYLKSLHGGVAPPFFFLHLPIAGIGNFLYPEGGLNSLPKKLTRTNERR